MASLLPPNTYGGNDNIIQPGNPAQIVDFNGLSFLLSDQNDFNIFSNGPNQYAFNSTYPGLNTGVTNPGIPLTSVTITAVPEPSPVALAGLLGLLGAAAHRWRRRAAR